MLKHDISKTSTCNFTIIFTVFMYSYISCWLSHSISYFDCLLKFILFHSIGFSAFVIFCFCALFPFVQFFSYIRRRTWINNIADIYWWAENEFLLRFPVVFLSERSNIYVNINNHIFAHTFGLAFGPMSTETCAIHRISNHYDLIVVNNFCSHNGLSFLNLSRERKIKR